MATCLSDWPVEELPCVQADMSLLLIMAKQFCPGYSSSIFSQATPYLTFQFPPLCKRWVLTYFRLFLRWERRSQKDKREREQRQGTAGLISSVLLPVSPKVWKNMPEDEAVEDPCLMNYKCSCWQKTAYWKHFLSCVSLFQSMFRGTYRLQCCYSDINVCTEDLNCH